MTVTATTAWSGGWTAAAAAGIASAILLAAPWVFPTLASPLPPSFVASAPAMDALFNLLVFGALLVAAIVAIRVDGGAPLSPGADAGKWLAIGATLGLAGVATTMLYAGLAGTLIRGDGGGASALIAAGAAVILLQSVAEEAYFRGWVQPSLRTRWGPAPALVATSLLFAGLHVLGGARTPLGLVNLFLGGAMFGLLALRSGGLAAPVGAHFAWNVTEQVGVGLDPNPGIGSFGAFGDWDLSGAGLWGGSAEGLNASLGTTVVLLAILVPLSMASRPLLRAGSPSASGRAVAA